MKEVNGLNDIKMVFVVRKDLNMRKGKLAAQVAHGCLNSFIEQTKSDTIDNEYTLSPSTNNKITNWLENNYTKIVLQCDNLEELEKIYNMCKETKVYCYKVYDLGFTEFHNKETLTCIAIGPDYSDKINSITENLKLM